MIQIQKLISLVHETKNIILNKDLKNHITEKGAADFVTQVDTGVQEYLYEKLKELDPGVQFIGEENNQNQIDPSEPAWILDPVDGTTNLIFDYQQSAVSLGYYENGKICQAVIYNPFSDETFWAVRGKGAFLNDCPIHVSSHKTLSESLVAIGTSPYYKEYAAKNFQIFQKVFEQCLDIRRSGSAALDLAYTACGRLDAYFELKLKPWDFAAGSLILEEAGGKITSYEGTPLNYLKPQAVFCSNGLIHEELGHILQDS